MQLLAKGAVVTALDRSKTRMQRLQENLQHRNLSADCIVLDARRYTPDTPPDIIVLDAPCSATGTWRKHPEVLHLLEEKALDKLVQLQRELIEHAFALLPVGGKLLYCVCSIHPDEGEKQLEWAKQHLVNMRIGVADNRNIIEGALCENGALRTHMGMLADKGGMDGFYAVIFEKHAA